MKGGERGDAFIFNNIISCLKYLVNFVSDFDRWGVETQVENP